MKNIFFELTGKYLQELSPEELNSLYADVWDEVQRLAKEFNGELEDAFDSAESQFTGGKDD